MLAIFLTQVLCGVRGLVTNANNYRRRANLKDRDTRHFPCEKVCTHKGFVECAERPLEGASVVPLRQRNAVAPFLLPRLARRLGLFDAAFGQLRVRAPSQLVVSV